MLRDLTLRRYPSKHHKQVWRDYEKVLMYRSMCSQFSRVIFTIVFTFLGEVHWQQSAKYVATGEPENNELALKVQSFAQLAYVLHGVGRIILFLLQLKWPHISKVNYYYELIDVAL